jgi:hypothetical protein
MLRLRNLTFVVLAAGGLFTAAILYPRPSSRKPLQAGEAFPTIEAFDIEGKGIRWPPAPFIVIYMRLDSEMGMQLQKYLRLQRQRHSQALPVVTIASGAKKDADNVIREADGRWPIVLDDGKWKERLAVGDAPFRLFVVDKASQITFSTDYAEPNDLRQLSEKALTGKIQYPSLDESAELRTGDRFAGFRAVDLRTNQEITFTPNLKSSVVCFTSHCPECDLEEAIRKYALHQAQFRTEPSSILLFSSRFSRTELVKTADRYGIRGPIFQATENIPGLEDRLSLETFSPTEIVQLELAADGTVERITYWNSNKDQRASAL